MSLESKDFQKIAAGATIGAAGLAVFNYLTKSGSKKTPSSIKLMYFGLPGRAEAARLAFTVAGIQFEDQRLVGEEWGKIKASGKCAPYNQLPALEVDGKMMFQSLAISKFAGELAGLVPSCPVERALMEEIICGLENLFSPVLASFGMKDGPAKVAARAELCAVGGDLYKAFVKMEDILKHRTTVSTSGFMVGGKLSLADICLFCTACMYKSCWLDGIPHDFIDQFSLVARLRKTVGLVPEIAAFYAKETDAIRTTGYRIVNATPPPKPAAVKKPTIIWTKTDEAPALATYSLLPIVKSFVEPTGVNVETRDISLAGRIISHFPECLTPEQRIDDHLSALGKLALTPEANIVKLPNISASVPQLKAALKELQGRGYKLPDFPEEAQSEADKVTQAKYKKCMGSAVNPVLREGNSDRRAPPAVKAYARQHPHSMGKWSSDSKSHVACMGKDDFFSNEQSVTMASDDELSIEHVSPDGTVKVMKKVKVLEGEVVDGTFLSKAALLSFLADQIADAKAQGVLFSVHLKATMMKVSDPIIFGHVVKVFFKDVFAKHGATFDKLGVNVNNGFGDLLGKIKSLPASELAAIEADIEAAYANGPDLAMVDSDKGITNLHVPSDVIIDASMPAAIRDSGKMWNKDNKRQDMKATIPDSSYASVYQATIDFCKKNGAFDPTTMGSVPNVGLMAQKAEEYGSHDKTFQIPAAGVVRVVAAKAGKLMEHTVAEGDVWRMCNVKDAPIRDWVKLAVNRARATKLPTVFWLDEKRAHDANLIKKINVYLKDHDTTGLELSIKTPEDACTFSCERIIKGLDTISVTGNVLRDYLTDLFPILEVGTSAKMLSIVPLMKGGGLFETGAGGSAPKHVQQFQQENHLRWDSLGEFLALAVSLIHVGDTYNNKQAKIAGETLDIATTTFLLNNKSPGRKVNQLDNRGSHYYLALYWAQEMAKQTEDAALATRFTKISAALASAEEQIVKELIDCQGAPCDTGGYYLFDEAKVTAAMRPSATLNGILSSM